uniref:Tyrosine-protein kinase-like otk n=1 Tax=Glossina pallidipes TaxID=7398 RepID=A0A1B0AGA3_GLOPL
MVLNSLILLQLLMLICGIRYFIQAETFSRFLTLPQNQTVIEGESADFACHATPTRGLIYSWTLNGQLLQNSTRVYQNGSDLHIEAVRRESDAGNYVCIATNVENGARQASPEAHLSIIWIQAALVQFLESKHSQVILKCHVEGSSADRLTEIEWFRNSEKLSTLQNIKLQENRLIISNPSYQDNGLYRCIASNEAGRVMSKKGYVLKWSENKAHGSYQPSSTNCLPRLKKNHILYENMKQIFLCRGKRGDSNDGNMEMTATDIRILNGPSKRVAVKENESVELTCGYNMSQKLAKEETLLRWRKDGKVIRQVDLAQTSVAAVADYSKDSRVFLSRHNGSLSFSSIVASDAGQYTCEIVASGFRPVISDTGLLEVIEQLKFMPQPTSSKNLELGSVGKVHCKAQGTPTPQVQWLKELEDPLPDSIEDINGTLTFKNVSFENRGNYTCYAANAQGKINATVSINVVVAPRFSVAPEGPLEVAINAVAMMHCQAIGDPKPTIQWDKDLEYLSDNNTDRNRFEFLDNGTLVVRNVQQKDEGIYGCTIGNSAGLKREEVRFIVKLPDSEDGGDGLLITRAVLITMSVALAYIVLVVGLMIWCRYRRQARKARLNEANRENPEVGEEGDKNAESEPCLPDSSSVKKVRKTNGSYTQRSSCNEAQKSDDTACSNHSKTSKRSNIYDQLSFSRSGISELIQIGRGEFGDVYVGKIKASQIKQCEDKDSDTEKQSNTNSDNGNGSATTTSTSVEVKRRSKTSMDDIEEIREEHDTGNGASHVANSNPGDDYKLVMVKALNKIKDEHICQEFKRQIEMFRTLTHKGVVRLYGLCREKDPHYMVLEYTDWGDLKQFLLATAGKVNTSINSSSSQPPPPLQKGQILAVAYQIARGMDAIYRSRFIHKDLASRNCIISSDFIVKVSYPALCKDKYSKEYYKHRNLLLPIRWLAPECIQEDEYTTKSDIFAFAVVVWELFTQAAKLPFEELSNEDVIKYSQTGKLEWKCADATPDSLKEILASCWNSNPKERPSFSQLCSALSKAIQSVDK